MTITPTTLTRAAGVAAAAAGLIFLAVQINHPPMVVASVTTTEWTVRNSMKALMSALALAGITGMYLRQVRQTGVLGLIGYLVFGAGYLVMLGIEFVATFVLPSLATAAPAYVNDVLAAAAGGTVVGDIGLLRPAIAVGGMLYLAGGLFFGIALFRTAILARWAAALLALGTLASIAIPLLPQVNERLFAVPTGVALVGLGHSLWQSERRSAAAPATSAIAAPLESVDAE
jgi:hypothetical protein